MQTINIDVVLCHHVVADVVGSVSSITLIQNDDPITVDELLNEFVSSEVIAGIDQSELIEEDWSGPEVFNARLGVFNALLAVLNTVAVIVQVLLAVFQQSGYP